MSVRRRMPWWVVGGVVAAIGVTGVGACGGKKAEPDPGARVAAVIETPATTPPQGTPPAVASRPEPVVAGGEKKPEPVVAEPAEPVKPAEPVVAQPAEPVKPAEPVVAQPAEPVKPAEPVVAQPAEPVKPAEPVEPGSGAQALAPDLVVADAAVTDAIVDRMPSTRKTAWKIGEDARLIGWFEFKNPGKALDVELVWKKDGVVSWRFPTSVGTGKNWRTWAEKRITKKDAGNWSVEVVDANGHVYESISYTVE